MTATDDTAERLHALALSLYETDEPEDLDRVREALARLAARNLAVVDVGKNHSCRMPDCIEHSGMGIGLPDLCTAEGGFTVHNQACDREAVRNVEVIKFIKFIKVIKVSDVSDVSSQDDKPDNSLRDRVEREIDNAFQAGGMTIDCSRRILAAVQEGDAALRTIQALTSDRVIEAAQTRLHLMMDAVPNEKVSNVSFNVRRIIEAALAAAIKMQPPDMPKEKGDG